jgi:hypothetical protein
MELLEARASLLGAMRAASGDRTAQAAREAHRRLRLREPTVEEAGAYRKNGDITKVRAGMACAESLLRLRSKPLDRGSIEAGRTDFQKKVEALLCGSVSPKDARHAKEFARLALSFSRLIAVHHRDRNGRRPDGIGNELGIALPHLARHLLTELELCMEERFVRPANNLCKVSVFDIRAKLGMLESHADKVVRDRSRTIIYAALHAGDLGLADILAEGAKAKLDELQGHADVIVSKYAKTILCTALRDGNLLLADTLAKGAKAKLDELQSHADKVVRDNAEAIVCAALRYGKLRFADRLAKGAADAFDKLKGMLGDGEAAETRLSVMLEVGILNAGARLKKAA